MKKTPNSQECLEVLLLTLNLLLRLPYCITDLSRQSPGVHQGKRRQERLVNPISLQLIKRWKFILNLVLSASARLHVP